MVPASSGVALTRSTARNTLMCSPAGAVHRPHAGLYQQASLQSAAAPNFTHKLFGREGIAHTAVTLEPLQGSGGAAVGCWLTGAAYVQVCLSAAHLNPKP